MNECQGVLAESQEAQQDDDDDFEEDDDEDEDSVGGAVLNNIMGGKKPKQSMFATLACSFMPKVNEILSEGTVKEKLMEVANFQTPHQKRDFLGALNEWYPFPERFHSYQLLCGGFDVKEPTRDFE